MKKISVGLVWHNLDSGNYGVGALSISHIEMLVSAAKRVGVSLDLTTIGTPRGYGLRIHREIEKKSGIKIKHINFGYKSLLADFVKLKFDRFFIFSDFDFVLDIGEGDSFSDIYGFRRFSMVFLTKLIGVVTKSKYVISPQTIGPFRSFFAGYISKKLLLKIKYVFVRDFKTRNYLEGIGVKSELVSDLAFDLEYEAFPMMNDSIGLNISGLLWNGGYSSNNQFDLTLDYQKVTRELINEFLSRGKKVHLIAHVITDAVEADDDYRVCQNLKKEYKNNANVQLAPKFESPTDAKSYIARMNFFVGARMHATIASISSGVPTIPVAYSRKFSGVFESVGYDHTLETYSGLRNQDFIKTIIDIYDEKKEILKMDSINASSKASEANHVYIRFLEEMLRDAK